MSLRWFYVPVIEKVVKVGDPITTQRGESKLHPKTGRPMLAKRDSVLRYPEIVLFDDPILGAPYAWSAGISDGGSGQKNDVALLVARGVDFSPLIGRPGFADVLEIDYRDGGLLHKTPGELRRDNDLGWNAAKTDRLRAFLGKNEADLTDIDEDVPLWFYMERLGVSINPDFRTRGTWVGPRESLSGGMGVEFNDLFSGGPELLSAHTPDTGSGWTKEVATGGDDMNVSGGIIANTGDSFNDTLIYIAETASPLSSNEYDVEGETNDIPTADDDYIYVVGRYANSLNYYGYGGTDSAATKSHLYKKVSGVSTQLGSTGATQPTAGDVLRLGISNAAKKGYINGVEQISSTDNALTAVGKGGLAFGEALISGGDIQAGQEWTGFSIDVKNIIVDTTFLYDFTRGLTAPRFAEGTDTTEAFTRSTTKTRVSPTTGNIEELSSGVASFEDVGGDLCFRVDPGKTNYAKHNRDFSNAVWSATNITVTTNDTTSPDGTANADLLTAGAANATLIQDLGTISSTKFSGSIYMKRKTGTGTVEITLDGGSTWIDITSDFDGSGFSRVWASQMLANPDFGIRLGTSGDAVWVWGAQTENNGYPTPVIFTTTATVSRNEDDLRIGSSGNAPGAPASCHMVSLPAEDIPDGDGSHTLLYTTDFGANGLTLQAFFSGPGRPWYRVEESSVAVANFGLGVGTDNFTNGNLKATAYNYSDNDFGLYTSGTFRSQDSSGTAPTTHTGDIILRGAEAGSWYYHSLRFLNRALTSGEVSDLNTDPFPENTIAILQASETDSAQAVTAQKGKALGQVAETDTAQPVDADPFARLLGQATETDLAQPISVLKEKTIGQAVASEAALSVTRIKIVTLGQANETDIAQPITAIGAHVVILGIASESDLPQSVSKLKERAIAQNTETDSAQVIAWAPKHRLIGIASESALAPPLTVQKLLALGFVTESDLAQSIAGPKEKAIGIAAETDTAQVVAAHIPRPTPTGRTYRVGEDDQAVSPKTLPPTAVPKRPNVYIVDGWNSYEVPERNE